MRTFILLLSLLMVMVYTATSQTSYLFVGTYTNTGNLNNPAARLDSTGSKGIYVYRFDGGDPGAVRAAGAEGGKGAAPAKGGKLRVTLLSHTEAAAVCNPSYLAITGDGHHLYACTESRMFSKGSVSAFDFDRGKGRLRLINKQPSGGDNPAYVSVSQEGRYVAVANYTGGSLSVYPVGKEGELLRCAINIQHFGHSIDSSRQDRPHVHSVVFSPEGRYLYTQDLGLDKIMIDAFDEGKAPPMEDMAGNAAGGGPGGFGARTRAADVGVGEATVATAGGSGPRHLVFSPNGRYAYLVEEMGGSVDVYRYHPESGALDSLQRIPAHAEDVKGPFRSADIHISPDGRFLYTSNRAESNIAIFSIEPATGLLKAVGYQPTFGKEPRNFTLDPSGRFLLVANQESNSIVVFRVDRATGLPERAGETIAVPAPTCLKMVP
jgi:6-phosphogluconolactonase